MTEKFEIRVGMRTYVLGAIVVALVTAFISFFGIFTTTGMLNPFIVNTYETVDFSQIYMIFFWPLVFSVIVALLTKAGVRVKKRDLVIITTMVYTTWMVPTFWGVTSPLMYLGVARQSSAYQRWTLTYGALTNQFWGPDPFKEEYWEGYLYGGKPVPWDAWGLAVAHFIIYSILYYFMMIFTVTLVRRLWLSVESLPFPLATGTISLINMSGASDGEEVKPTVLSNVYLWAGTLVGILGLAPYWIPLFTGGELPPTWDGAGSALNINLMPYLYTILPYAPASFDFHAWMIGACFLIPSNMQLTYIVFEIIVEWIWAPIMVYIGVWDPPQATTERVSIRSQTGAIGEAWSTYFGGNLTYFAIGAMFTAIFMPMFIHRGEVVRQIKAIFKRDKELEANEALPYRYLLAGYIVCIIGLAILFYITSAGYANILWSIISLILVSTLYMSLISGRVTAEMGAITTVTQEGLNHNWVQHTRWAWIIVPNSPFYIADLQQRYLAIRTDLAYSYFNMGNPSGPTLEAYKIGEANHVHPRSILKGILIAMPISIIVTYITYLTLIYNFGFVKTLTKFNYMGWLSNYPQRAVTYGCREVADWHCAEAPTWTSGVAILIGGIVAVICQVLRTIYPWFPLHPIGFSLFFFQLPNIFFPMIIAYIARRVIITIGGLEMYEKRALPFAVGLVASLGIMVVIGALFLAYQQISVAAAA